jgi:hypothetical protein
MMKPTTLAAGLAAAVPVIVSTVRGVAAGVAPAGDRAIIALRAYDVFTSHTPLVGQYSASTVLSGRVVHSPGPMLYWLLALPVRLGSPSSPTLVVGIVNALAVILAVALARRRGGVALMLASALAIVLLSRSWSPETLHDIWNPSAGLLPFTLLIFLCWSLACGDHRLLPLVALTASFVVQTELTFLAPSLALLAVGLAGLARARSGRVWPWALAAVLVLAVCWAPPVIDELEHSPGNLTLLVRLAGSHDPKQGLAVGWHAVVRAVGISPWWLNSPGGPFTRFSEVRTAPGTLAVVSALLMLGALLAVLLAGVLRGRRDVVAGAAIGLVLCLALGAVAAATPTRASVETSLGYTMWWGSQAGMWVWLMLGFAAAALLRRGRLAGALSRRAASRARTIRADRSEAGSAARARRRGRLPAAACVAGLVLLLASAGVVAADQGADQDQWEYKPVGAINARLIAALGPSVRTVRLTGTPDGFDFRMALAFALRRHGVGVLDPAAAVRLDSRYAVGSTPYQAIVGVGDAAGHRGAGRLIATVPAHAPSGRPILVTLERAPSPTPTPTARR